MLVLFLSTAVEVNEMTTKGFLLTLRIAEEFNLIRIFTSTDFCVYTVLS